MARDTSPQRASNSASMKIRPLSYVLCGLISATLLAPYTASSTSPAPKQTEAGTENDRPLVQLALLLDTSNSMDGLIAQAKTQLWQIVNEFIAAKQDGKAPRVEVALYEYGNDGLSAEKGYVRQVTPLTIDLDKISESLFALKTNGGSEYCGWVIRDAVRDLAWNKSSKVYKAIFIAGNEPFTQGAVKYGEACKSAVEQGIIVNTIHCGDQGSGISGKWKDGAVLADGKFMTIDTNAQVAHVNAPQDKEIAELNSRLNTTYYAYGRGGAEGKQRQVAQDENAATAPAAPSITAQRAKTKASANYDNSSWDLLDAVKQKKFDLAKAKDEELPEELRKIEPAKRAEFVAAKQKEREEVQTRLRELTEARDKYVSAQLKQKPKDKRLDEAVGGAVREQAAKKAFVFESAR
jgi:hypothetical protein